MTITVTPLRATALSPLRIAALLIATYGVAVIANALLYTSWSGDSSELARAAARTLAMGAIAHGLWQGRRWAWWAGVISSALFGLLGVLGLLMARASGAFASRPHPALDYLFFAVTIASLLAALGILLSPRGRRTS